MTDTKLNINLSAFSSDINESLLASGNLFSILNKIPF